MKSFDFEAYTMSDGTVVCLDCIRESGECSRQIEEAGGFPIFVGSEWDCYPTCDYCGEKKDYVMLTYELCPDCDHIKQCLGS